MCPNCWHFDWRFGHIIEWVMFNLWKKHHIKIEGCCYNPRIWKLDQRQWSCKGSILDCRNGPKLSVGNIGTTIKKGILDNCKKFLNWEEFIGQIDRKRKRTRIRPFRFGNVRPIMPQTILSINGWRSGINWMKDKNEMNFDNILDLIALFL